MKKRNITNKETERRHLLEHLLELRHRLLWSIGVFFVAFFLAYSFSHHIIRFLSLPLTEILSKKAGRRFIYTNLSEAFFTYVKVSFFGACVFSSPFWTWQLWKFVQPGLYPQERRWVSWVFFSIPPLFLLGAFVAYFIVCPFAWKFFLHFENNNILSLPLQFEARISEYLAIVIKMMMVFGIGFQLPVFLVTLVALGVVHIDTLKRGRKYAFLLITIVAAILTPPDLISPIGLMIPLYLLYEGALLYLGRLSKSKLQRLSALTNQENQDKYLD